MQKVFIEKDIFVKKYIGENLTIEECAKYFNCGKSTIVRFCKEKGINKPKELINNNNSRKSRLHDHDLVNKLYFEENLTKKQISEKLDIKLNSISKIISLSNQTKTSKQKIENKTRFKISRSTLYHLFIVQNKSLKELVQMFGVGETTILNKLNIYGIRKPKELRKELVVKRFEEIGKANIVNNQSVYDLSKKIGLSITCINRFVKENKDLDDVEIEKALSNIALNKTSSLEEKVSGLLDLRFYGNKIKIGYKPDFKLNNNLYLNVDGLYWHSEVNQKNNRYHFDMRKRYEDEGIRIIQFREDEIYQKPSIVCSMIKNLTNKELSVRYGRKCVVEAVGQKQADEFLRLNHLMGTIKAKHLGLFYENELISIISYKLYGKSLKIERFCTRLGHRVLGGFSKLLKQVEKDLDFEEVLYWVDLRYGSGKYLEKLGFTHSHDTLGWKWTDFTNTYNRRTCVARDGLSERENANRLGLFKIYDAGQRLYKK